MLQVIYRFPILKNWFPNGVPIYGFGLMLFCAFILCTWLAGKRGEREWIKKETIQDLAIWIFIGGLLGARITFLLQERPLPGFVEFITKLPRIWDGGIILYGSLIGALVGYSAAYLFFFRKQGLSTLRLADVIAPSIAIGLCFGRMGCFLNGCCYGQVACGMCRVPCLLPDDGAIARVPGRERLTNRGGFHPGRDFPSGGERSEGRAGEPGITGLRRGAPTGVDHHRGERQHGSTTLGFELLSVPRTRHQELDLGRACP